VGTSETLALAGEVMSYKRLIDIYSSSSKTIDALMKLELPSGVEVEIKV
jgi:small subunit ribosomal protein S10